MPVASIELATLNMLSIVTSCVSLIMRMEAWRTLSGIDSKTSSTILMHMYLVQGGGQRRVCKVVLGE